MTNTIEMRTDALISAVKREFNRLNTLTHSNVNMNTEILDKTLWIAFSKDNISGSINIPLPYVNEKNLELLENNDVKRVLCNYWIEKEELELNYHDIIEYVICENINKIKPHLDSGSSFLQKIIKSFDQQCAQYMINRLQRELNEITNSMPLHETDMNSWAMNHRLIIIDPAFNSINDPNDKLTYQVEKNKKYYETRGWTSIGLSDGVLADKNTILTMDLKNTIPFGMYHNPQRNLYSTLGMKGDELPKVQSATMRDLLKQGISRTGWNLTTAIMDTPLNFEDQILVDNRLRGLFTTVERKFIVYNKEVMVKENDNISTNDTIGISVNGDSVIMDLVCDSAIVTKVKLDVVNVGNQPTEVQIVTIKGKRYLRDGSKFCNLCGNKGVIHFLDLGYAIDPRNGLEIPIDVMISATSINKRKNFSQIMEAITNNVVCNKDVSIVDDRKVVVINDNYYTDKKNVEAMLEKRGFPKDGTWAISTYCGEFKAIVGKIFWGLTKSPEDQLWSKGATTVVNNRELRNAGLKFSHVEIKALTTRFGVDNAIISEILSHAQGIEILQDEVNILKSAIGDYNKELPVIDMADIKYVDGSQGIFHTIEEIAGTIVDENYMPEGFILKLPTKFQVIIDKDDARNFTCGIPQEVQNPDEKIVYEYDKIFIPNSIVRRCWRHGSGKWGLNVIGGYINNIVRCGHAFINNEENITDHINLMRAVTNYFINIANIMSTKTGELSTYGMSVRYPHSAKATITLADNLPKNTLEIHRDMAEAPNIKTGDIVIAERFPCLGFMSIRPQYVRVTDDPMCRYVIRASGNSLTSMSLDFDGDTLFIASFHTPQAKELLKKEMADPNKICEDAIEQMNSKKIPQLKEMTLDNFNIHKFRKPTNEEHAELVRKATGVKSHTGPVIALAYNLMRIVENNIPYDNIEEHVHLELLLDFLGNTVFKQKHGIKSLQEEATNAICTADVDAMVNLGFDRRPSLLLCNLIIKEGALLGTYNLADYHKKAKQMGWSKIINRIVRKKNKIYFATRASLGPFSLLEHLNEKAVDLPSYTLKKILRSEREKIEDKLLRLSKEERKKRKGNKLVSPIMKEIYKLMSDFIDKTMIKEEHNGFKQMDSSWQD